VDHAKWSHFLEHVEKEYGSLRAFDDHFAELVKGADNELVHKQPLSHARNEKLLDININREILVVSNHIWEEILRELYKSPNKLKTIDPRSFEELVAFLFDNFGYEVELTGRTRDGGRDIIALQKKVVLTKYLIECKRPDPDNKIGIGPVRELYGVKVDEGASKAILATSTYFTKDANLFMERHKWELEPRDFDGVMDWIEHYRSISK